jgi:hypothetical protein
MPEAQPEHGLFLIADISGYTAYLAGGEIEHAPVIASDLLTKTVDGFTGVFEINKLEGDAVFAYSTKPLGERDLFDVLDGTYAGFRQRLLSVTQATSCGCAACGTMPRLDLKLITHAGRFLRQRIAGREELAGRDVIVAHRLLKNSLGESGRPGGGYALITEECLREVGIDPQEHGMVSHVETYEHLGEVPAWVVDLGTRYQARPRWTPSSKSPLAEIVTRLPAAPPEVWALLAPGRSDSCVTHRLSSLQEIIEWDPFERLAVRVGLDHAIVIHQLELAADGDGTRVVLQWHRGRRRPNAPGWSDLARLVQEEAESTLREARRRLDLPPIKV